MTDKQFRFARTSQCYCLGQRENACSKANCTPFNTYFPSEATCQFVTGQGELDRRENIGFRCALTLGHLRPLP